MRIIFVVYKELELHNLAEQILNNLFEVQALVVKKVDLASSDELMVVTQLKDTDEFLHCKSSEVRRSACFQDYLCCFSRSMAL